jgi:hypothetical protein
VKCIIKKSISHKDVSKSFLKTQLIRNLNLKKLTKEWYWGIKVVIGASSSVFINFLTYLVIDGSDFNISLGQVVFCDWLGIIFYFIIDLNNKMGLFNN